MRLEHVERLLTDELLPTDPPGLVVYTGAAKTNFSGDAQIRPGDVLEVRGLHGTSPYIWVKHPDQDTQAVVKARDLAPHVDGQSQECDRTRDLGHGVVLTCERPPQHSGKHLMRDEQGRRTEWWGDPA